MTSVQRPPTFHAVTRELRGVMTRAQIDMGFVQTDVVQAMRYDFAFAIAGKVMIQHGQGLSGVKRAVPVKIAEHLFLLGVHGEYGLTSRQVRGLERCDVFKLRVALRVLLERRLLLRLTANKAMLLQQLANNPATDRGSRRANAPGNLRLAQMGPTNGVLRTARRMLSNDVQKRRR